MCGTNKSFYLRNSWVLRIFRQVHFSKCKFNPDTLYCLRMMVCFGNVMHLIRVTVDLKPILGTLGLRNALWMGNQFIKKAACTQTHSHRRFRITKPPDIFVWGERNTGKNMWKFTQTMTLAQHCPWRTLELWRGNATFCTAISYPPPNFCVMKVIITATTNQKLS